VLFLYNTLGSIRYQIKDERIRKSIDSLISYYRIVLSKGALLVSIESEIKMIEDYLNLQVFSFDIQNIQVVYHIDESVKKYMIVKHLLQPIIENALEHGVRGKEEGGTIFVNAGLEGENVVFEIKDTGVGMTPEQIKEVTSGVSGSGQSGGYGIYNVIQRIKAYYGPQYGVEFFASG
jgi:sensor histidine kinase YesM